MKSLGSIFVLTYYHCIHNISYLIQRIVISPADEVVVYST
jgi:hypothetical protein